MNQNPIKSETYKTDEIYYKDSKGDMVRLPRGTDGEVSAKSHNPKFAEIVQRLRDLVTSAEGLSHAATLCSVSIYTASRPVAPDPKTTQNDSGDFVTVIEYLLGGIESHHAKIAAELTHLRETIGV